MINNMEKAYDRLEWDFLFQVLLRFGFHPGWVNYIRAMFTNCWFSVLYNGGAHGFFKSTRGLRQGDPLAPSLFILAQEVHLVEGSRLCLIMDWSRRTMDLVDAPQFPICFLQMYNLY